MLHAFFIQNEQPSHAPIHAPALFGYGLPELGGGLLSQCLLIIVDVPAHQQNHEPFDSKSQRISNRGRRDRVRLSEGSGEDGCERDA